VREYRRVLSLFFLEKGGILAHFMSILPFYHFFDAFLIGKNAKKRQKAAFLIKKWVNFRK
jgi:hypothetical protein